MFSFFVILIFAYALLSLFRVLIAFLEIRKQQKFISTLPIISEKNVTVLQPILGGDPALSYCLETNLKNAPLAHFIWLLDENDEEGINAAKKAIFSSGAINVELQINPAPPKNLNPKMWKLALGIKDIKTKFLAFIDDDTMLPKGSLSKCIAIADRGNLVTGLPLYSSHKNILSCLVSGFVNSSSIITYLPTSYFKMSNTINGMFSVMRVSDIKLNDFESIMSGATDDYALAKIFKNKGLGIAQTIVTHPIITTISSFHHYNGLMKRWMIFARIYLRENLNLSLSLLIIVPSILPLLLIITAAVIDPLFFIPVTFFVMLIKAMTLKMLRSKLGFQTKKADMFFEVIAEIISPFYFLLASIHHDKITWRNSNFSLSQSGKIKNDL
jgi:ceramide glucosyltransferase